MMDCLDRMRKLPLTPELFEDGLTEEDVGRTEGWLMLYVVGLVLEVGVEELTHAPTTVVHVELANVRTLFGN